MTSPTVAPEAPRRRRSESPTAAPPTVVGRGLRVQYGEQVALDSVDLDVRPGEVVALLGQSGSGKSTLMKTLTGLTPFTADSLDVAGRDVAAQSPAGLRELRSDVGYVFQHFNLVPRLTALTNVLTGGLHAAGPINQLATFSSAQRATALISWNAWASRTRPSSAAGTSAAANSSAWPSPAPSCSSPASSWPTNPSRPWTRAWPGTSWACCAASPAKSRSP